ncbi:copper amine oxidase N-terminal domain-containing protein [Crassaminicella indica]|uniref:Copper amine oxidase N-terminal domain-containing protein n=1 Tax=Crassaminicella indica TaxID=2855394 RepID=A0ABX8RCG6_9CLOT|nr:copper amine oxidase N-terminal domain-containing protein [Crassaminicella indica]QXM06747.1 copper amine oxidase N-terminal domain-containing protein [Crassaminicella indica]
MKRKISLLLVLALMLSLVPMSAFAASDNTVNKVPKVSDSTVFDNTNAPELRIEEKNAGEFTDGMTFTLKVNNGDWTSNMDGATVAKVVYDADGTVAASTATVRKRSSSEVDVIFTKGADAGKVAIILPLYVDIDNEGEVSVEIISNDTPVTAGKYVIAVAADGSTVTTINDTTDITEDGATIETIKIEETNIGAINNNGAAQDIELKLPSDFKWDASGATFEKAGGFTGANPTVTSGDGTNKLTINGIFDSTGSRGKLYITGLRVIPKSDADYGDITVRISGDKIKTTTLNIGKYVDYDVTVQADTDDDMAEIFAGKLSSDDDDHELATLEIEENGNGSWLLARKTRIEFPEWVRIINVQVDKAEYIDVDNDGVADSNTTIANKLLATRDEDANYVEFSGWKNTSTTSKAKLHVTFFVSVEAGKTGDIVAKVSGRALTEEKEVVLGKAVAPVEVKAEAENVKLGLKDQAIGKIVIKETTKGALEDGKYITLKLAEGFYWNDEPKVEVTKGDLEIDEDSIKVEYDGTTDKNDERYVTFKIKDDSTEASEITITGGTVDLYRTLPEGDYEVEIMGDALVQNYLASPTEAQKKAGKFDTEKVATEVVARVITPADDNTKAGQEVKFVIGKAEYQVGDELKTADVAPYIADGRTMLSLRYVAEAMGVTDENIIWDGATRTVTIFKGDRIAQVQIGSNKLFVNGVVVPMDTVAVIKDGRTMLPIRFIAQALGAEVEWDGATRTVTIK